VQLSIEEVSETTADVKYDIVQLKEQLIQLKQEVKKFPIISADLNTQLEIVKTNSNVVPILISNNNDDSININLLDDKMSDIRRDIEQLQTQIPTDLNEKRSGMKNDVVQLKQQVEDLKRLKTSD
jgi:chromosome segregation ATPase